MPSRSAQNKRRARCGRTPSSAARPVEGLRKPSDKLCAPRIQRMSAMTVRTRFAPSPTGYLHIGGLRTALFSWLWARHTGGTFILRIDDTDQERNVEAALGPIFRAFEWLGLNWDEGPKVGGPYEPYYQSQRNHLYQAAV